MAASIHDRLVLLQLFMAVTAATALLLGAAIAEGRTAERRRAADYSVTQALNESPTLATAAPRILAGMRENLVGRRRHLDPRPDRRASSAAST